MREEPPRPEDLEVFQDEHDAQHRVMTALSKIGIALRSRAWKDAGPRGLTPTQAQILVTLGRTPERGRRLGDIADALAVSAPTVSDAVTTLEQKSLIVKNPAPDDARALAISLTSEGEAQAREVSEWPDLLLSTVDVLDAGERAVLLRALVKIVRELQERGEISTSRMCATCRFFQPRVYDDSRRPHHCAFVDAPFGDQNLRLECAEHEPAPPDLAAENWARFTEDVGA